MCYTQKPGSYIQGQGHSLRFKNSVCVTTPELLKQMPSNFIEMLDMLRRCVAIKVKVTEVKNLHVKNHVFAISPELMKQIFSVCMEMLSTLGRYIT